jgi:hypothetical protein
MLRLHASATTFSRGSFRVDALRIHEPELIQSHSNTSAKSLTVPPIGVKASYGSLEVTYFCQSISTIFSLFLSSVAFRSHHLAGLVALLQLDSTA